MSLVDDCDNVCEVQGLILDKPPQLVVTAGSKESHHCILCLCTAWR